MIFDQAFHELLGHEGQYSNNPADPGGATCWGVTERVARAKGYTGDMRDLPVEFAKERVYRPDYWDVIRADELPPALRYAVFDAAVNSGPKQALLWLQRAIGAEADGRIGQQTISMSRAAQPDFALRRMISQRLRFMADLPAWPSFGRGWAKRLATILEI